LKVWRTDQVFALARFSPQSDTAPAPVYEEPLRVASLERAPRVFPREIPEMVELVRPALSRVPDIV
jgi:hypothetical protein